MSNAPGVYLLSLGCDKNRVDGEVMLGRLLAAGYTLTDEPAEAEIIVVNTCGFIREAVQESIDLILEMAAYKTSGACKRLIVVGCMTERYREEVNGELPEVDAVLGVADRDKILDVVRGESAHTKTKSSKNETLKFRLLAHTASATPHIAHIKIADGCDNHCTYCAIPSIRGGYVSRPSEDILAECRALIEAGVRELVLVAQDTTLYGSDLYGAPRLHRLLYEINDLCENFNQTVWVRLLYAYPEHITHEIIEAIATLPTVCKYLDMPVQHSETTVLARMGRSGSRDSLCDLITRLRARVSGITLRTTLMVGFPGETDEEFDGLYNFAQQMRFDRLGVFPYSQESGTAAAEMPDQLDEETKHARRDRLMELQQRVHRDSQRARLGNPQPVMVDDNDGDMLTEADTPKRYIGRTQGDAFEVDAVVYFSSHIELQPGQVVWINPTDADEYDLYGEAVHELAK